MDARPFFSVVALMLVACSGEVGGGDGGAGGSASNTSAGKTSASSTTTSSTKASTGTQSTSATTGSTTDTTGAGPSTTTGGGDPFEAARQACIAKINALRATKSLTPYTRWMSAESCVDQQATADETSGTAHGAWLSGTYACNGNAQNECLGQGPNGIESCLDQMWNEKNQAGCAGCDACADAYNPNCPNCDFYGQQTGQVCGHYVNLSAKYLSEAACGFSSLGGWDAINFQ